MAGRFESSPPQHQHQLRGSPQLLLLFLFLLFLQYEPHGGSRGAKWARGTLTQSQLGWYGQLDGPSYHHRHPSLSRQQFRLSPGGPEPSPLAQIPTGPDRDGRPCTAITPPAAPEPATPVPPPQPPPWPPRPGLLTPTPPPQSRLWLGPLPARPDPAHTPQPQPIPQPSPRLPDSLQTPRPKRHRVATERLRRGPPLN